MSLKTFSAAAVSFAFLAAVATGQQVANPIPAATRSQADCTGFITKSSLSTDITVFNGGNNDLASKIRQYTPGEPVYLRSRSKSSFSVGEEFSLVRPANKIFRTTRYNGEHWAIRALGKPFEDVGKVTVTNVTPEGAVAEVNYTCTPVVGGDIAMVYQPRPIPTYVPKELDRFALPNGNKVGVIAAARTNYSSLMLGDIVYLNLGKKDGVEPGQRYRVYFIRYKTSVSLGTPPTPRETVGEVIVLSTQEKSSAAIIINAKRNIDVGYGVELE
jgi:hypothetical protein